MKKWIIILCILFVPITVHAEEEPKELYAQSAVLMDAESGRVLFEKNGYEEKPMASTTKIMTCILALEHGNLEDVVTFSENAAAQPEVHLGAGKDTQFRLKDLLYSLMLESHNDSAVAIAEHIAGSAEAFAVMMNQKALSLGCNHTHYITPNGLDAQDDGGNHDTTAADLARIMSYCILESEKKETFLEITQTVSYSFTELAGSRTFSCTNHNRFLSMMEGAISGKTGYTSKAGYCYVGALERDGRTFVVALLACGWPNHKNYKWEDTKKLMQYAVDNYEYRNVYEKQELPEIEVVDGVPGSGELFSSVILKPTVLEEPLELLLKEEEKVDVKVEIQRVIQAPVKQGDVVGKITYYLKDQIVKEYDVLILETVEKKTTFWIFMRMAELYLEILKRVV